MYKKLKLDCKSNFSEHIQKGMDQVAQIEKDLDESFKSFVLSDGTLNGKAMTTDWFPPKNKYHIFISHSHKDLNLALGIAGILKTLFLLVSGCILSSAGEKI